MICGWLISHSKWTFQETIIWLALRAKCTGIRLKKCSCFLSCDHLNEKISKCHGIPWKLHQRWIWPLEWSFIHLIHTQQNVSSQVETLFKRVLKLIPNEEASLWMSETWQIYKFKLRCISRSCVEKFVLYLPTWYLVKIRSSNHISTELNTS